MFSHIDSNGHHFQLFSKITDHRYDGNTINISDGFTKLIYGNNVPKKNMFGWKIQVGCKDLSKLWIPLKDLKSSNTLELSGYTINNKIEHEPAFHW